MKTTNLGRVITTALVLTTLFSCKKETASVSEKNYMQTTITDMKTDSTSVILSLATELAQKFLQSKNPNITITIKNAETIIKNGIPYIHIINTNNNAGFAMIAADSIYAPILAYDSIGNFNKNNLNAGLALWFNKHGRNLAYIRTNKSASIDSIIKSNKNLWLSLGEKYGIQKTQNEQPEMRTMEIDMNPTTTVSYSGYSQSVGPLCQSYWNQTYPYNLYCPSGSYGGHVPAGCVPVAMAQIMHYWNFPTTYNHSIMPFSLVVTPYASNVSGYNETARLIHNIGTTDITKWTQFTGQFVSYDDAGSSANDYYCPSVFGEFGYSSASRTETVSDQILWGAKNGTVYSGLLIDEIINNQRPCLVSGYGGQNDIFGLGIVYYPYFDQGHSWVCDGCNQNILITTYTTTYNPIAEGIYPPTIVEVISRQGYLHMNWGWGPYSLGGDNNNGWYNYNINYSNAPNGTDYGYFQTIVYNIHP